MRSKGIAYIGSLQDFGFYFQSDDPLREVWHRVARFGVSEYVHTFIEPSTPDVDWEAYVRYATVRVRQSVEFRAAASQSSLLTSPLSLYYSFLNLMRAFMILREEAMSPSSHGLVFHKGSDILSSYATLSKGTFKTYLEVVEGSPRTSLRISLDEALMRIIELGYDYSTSKGRGWTSLVATIRVEARNNDVRLHFPDNFVSFRENWAQDYPALANSCMLESEGNTLKVSATEPISNLEEIQVYLNKKLHVSLIPNQFMASYYLVRQVDNILVLPRPAYYYVAIFILGSIVRYEPDLLLEINNPESQLGWLVQRVLASAERYYPQLMLSWSFGREVYV